MPRGAESVFMWGRPSSSPQAVMPMLGRVREELGFLRGNLLVLMVSYMVFGFASGLFGPFRSPYIRELGASPLVLGS